MRKICAGLLALIICITAAFAPPAAGEARAATNPYGYVHIKVMKDYEYAYSVLSKVNKARKAQGLKPLKMDKSLLSTAMKRAAETAVYWEHIRPNGKDCFSASSKMYGENIAAGQPDPKSVMESWLNSPGHYANIMGAGYTTIGIGVVKVNGLYYWVQNFGYDKGTRANKSDYKNVNKTYKIQVKKASNVYTTYSTKAFSSIKKGQYTYMTPYADNGVWEVKLSRSDFTYSSSDKSIAVVSSKGKVTGRKKGTVTITAKLKDYPSIKYKKKITVK